MKRLLVLVVGLVFMFSTVAFAADKKGDKGAGKEKAPAVTAEPAKTEAPAAEKKADKKADKKKAGKKGKKGEKKEEKK